MSDDLMGRLCRYDEYGEYDPIMECWHDRLANPDGPEAAAEITRLRAEVERLARERDEANAKHVDMLKRWGREIESLMDARDAAEWKVEVLREALIVCEKDLNDRGIRHDDFRQQIVRAALAETETKE